MTDNAWPWMDLVFLMATAPLAILSFLWAISARDRSPRWIYMGSKWTAILLLVPWLTVTIGIVSDLVSGL